MQTAVLKAQADAKCETDANSSCRGQVLVFLNSRSPLESADWAGESLVKTPVWITPALTEASKSVQFVKMESDAMVAKRTSDD